MPILTPKITSMVCAMIMVITFSMALPANAQQCEVRCFTSCSPSGRCCRQCVRQCYTPPPPTYIPSYTYTPPYQYAGPAFPLDPATIGLAIIGIMAGIIAVIASAAASGSGASDIDAEIAKVEGSTASARTLGRDAERTSHQIDSYIESAASDARVAGRAAADREWEAWTRE